MVPGQVVMLNKQASCSSIGHTATIDDISKEMMERGDDTHRPIYPPRSLGGVHLDRSWTVRPCLFVMTPPQPVNTSEGGRDDRGVPYPAESTLSSAQVLKGGTPRPVALRPKVCGGRALSGTKSP